MSIVERLFRLTMRNVCAGVVTNDLGNIVRTAPILNRFMHQNVERLREWARQYDGEVHEVMYGRLVRMESER